jgi:hypothetical protein
MRDYMDLVQTTPNDEPCAQVGNTEYEIMARIEANALIHQLQRVFGNNPPGTRFKIIQCPHDAGIYLDIRFYYDDEIQEHVKYLTNLDAGCDVWDTEAKNELKAHRYELTRSKKCKVIPFDKAA